MACNNSLMTLKLLVFIPTTNVTYSLTLSVLFSFQVWSNWINTIGLQHTQIIVTVNRSQYISIIFDEWKNTFERIFTPLEKLQFFFPKEKVNIIKVYYLVTLQLDSIRSFSISNRLEGRLYSKGEDILFKRSKPTQNFAPISSSSLVPICNP